MRGGDPKVLEGSDPARRSVILEFDSLERASEWYHSPQYEAVKQIRQKSATTKAMLLTGHSDG